MTRNKFYNRCNIISVICLISMITFALLSSYAFGNYKPSLGILFVSIALLSFFIGIGVTIAGMGEYKPKKWPPTMPFPIIHAPYKYGIVYLDETYWRIDYYKTYEEARVAYDDAMKDNKLHITAFKKVYDQSKGYDINKELYWS